MPKMKTVGELMAYLSTQPPDRSIILSSDSEGNSYASLADAGEVMIDASEVGLWDLRIYPTREEVLNPKFDFDPEEDMPPDDAVCVVVLGPIN